ncbi:hypothetical protein OFN71_32085, partial [Escherichia coli]|nr:hypothetical protein [Escherichia coli]
SGLSVSECRQQPSSAIFIGIEDVESKHDDSVKTTSADVLDIWRHPVNDEIRALSVASTFRTTTLQTDQHLAWTVTLLALDFPIEDALTL